MPWDNKTLATLKAMGGGSGSGGVSSWNDLTDKPFYSEESKVVFLPSMQLTNGQNYGGMVMYQMLAEKAFVQGLVYTVNWNGTIYQSTTQSLASDIILGNLAIVGAGADTGEPFLMMTAMMGEHLVLMIYAVGTDAVTLEITVTEKFVKPLDPLYLPEHQHSYIEFKEFEGKMGDRGNYSNIAYGNGRFVALNTSASQTDEVLYSEDEIEWKMAYLPSRKSWNSVTYGNGKFFMYASSSVAYSEDGEHWTEEELTNQVLVNKTRVVFWNGLFVALSDGGDQEVAYSEDGVSWSTKPLPKSSIWRTPAYNDDMIVTVGADVTKTATMYSRDGINWTESTMPVEAMWNVVCYGNGKFVAFGYDPIVGAYSEDGINWTAFDVPTLSQWNGTDYGWYTVAYGNDKFVALPYVGSAAIYSKDGVEWAMASLPERTYWEMLVYGGGKFVAPYSPGKAAYSIDGTSWSENCTYAIQGETVVTPEKLGFAKVKAPAIADVTATPTAEEFNALLASLRAAGYLATE